MQKYSEIYITVRTVYRIVLTFTLLLMLFELMSTIFIVDGPSVDNVGSGSTVHIFTVIVHYDVPE
jgi:hypothetical protein